MNITVERVESAWVARCADHEARHEMIEVAVITVLRACSEAQSRASAQEAGWGRYKSCSECGGEVEHPERGGRPRFTCSRACGESRRRRLQRAPALAETPEERAALDDFNQFAKYQPQEEQ